MSDSTNDIEALLDYLDAQCLPGYRKALTALVAERDALKQRAAELESQPPAASERRARLVESAMRKGDSDGK